MTENITVSIADEIARAIGDPGSVLPRTEGESVTRWAARAVEALLAPAPCAMKHEPPMDFAWCETHDTTFALGDKCKFDGRQAWEVYADEADEQRGRAVMAELKVEQLEAELAIWKPKPPVCPKCGETSVAHVSQHLISGPRWTCTKDEPDQS